MTDSSVPISRTLERPIPNLRDDFIDITYFLNEWFGIFNSAFFAGALGGGRVQILVKRGWRDAYMVEHKNVQGVYRHPGQLSININMEKHAGFQGNIEHAYLSSLLHELTHAFLEFYSCKCESCKVKQHPLKLGRGSTGHGPSWANSIRKQRLFSEVSRTCKSSLEHKKSSRS